MSGVYTNIAKKRIEQSAAPTEPTGVLQPEPAHKYPIGTHERSPGTDTYPTMSTKPQAHLSTNNSPVSSLEKPEKYTTHLEPSLIKRLKIYATERDMKDYQVVRDALLLYFEENK